MGISDLFLLSTTLICAPDLMRNKYGTYTVLGYFIGYGTSDCSPQGISWLPSHGYLNRSMQASTRVRRIM